MSTVGRYRTSTHDLLERQFGCMFHRGQFTIIDPVAHGDVLATELIHVLGQFLVMHMETAVVSVLITEFAAEQVDVVRYRFNAHVTSSDISMIIPKL
ncbi:hypothetical protein D1872_319110 [compost metagenome]